MTARNTPWLKATSVLAEDPNSVSSTHIGRHTTACHSSPGASSSFSWTLHSRAYPHKHIQSHNLKTSKGRVSHVNKAPWVGSLRSPLIQIPVYLDSFYNRLQNIIHFGFSSHQPSLSFILRMTKSERLKTTKGIARAKGEDQGKREGRQILPDVFCSCVKWPQWNPLHCIINVPLNIFKFLLYSKSGFLVSIFLSPFRIYLSSRQELSG